MRTSAVAAAVLIVMLVGLLFLGSGRPEGSELLADDGDRTTSRPVVVKIRPDGQAPRRERGDWDYSRLCHLLEASQLIVFGQVARIGAGEIDFAVQETIWGKGEELRSIEVGGGEEAIACQGPLSWREGERCVLFLRRTSTEGTFHVVYGGSGKHALPFGEHFELEDLARAARGERIAAGRIEALVERSGLGPMRSMAYELGDEGLLDATAPAVQAAIRDALAAYAGRESLERDDHYPFLVEALPFATSETLLELDPEARARLLEHARRFLEAGLRVGEAYEPMVARGVERLEAVSR